MKNAKIIINHSFLGTMIFDKGNEMGYRVNKSNRSYKKASFKIMQALSTAYKGYNVLHKPFIVLVYQQVIKHARYNMEQLNVPNAFFHDYFLKKYKEEI